MPKPTQHPEMPTPPDSAIRLACLMAAVLLVSAGCQTLGGASYTGRQARPDNRLDIRPGGPHTDQWRTADMALDLEYTSIPGGLDLAGQVGLSDGNRKFPSIKRMVVNIHFLDREGIILSTQTLWYSGYWVPMYAVNWGFHRRVSPPDGAEKMAFSYSGTVGENGAGFGDDAGGGVEWDFWKGP